ncbi:Peroxisomal membrane protein PAS20 [Thoreauomyces humboldtii]|nr:Peroxisomal membrane protein PAS20 [Thoreauomyces humboldtii]
MNSPAALTASGYGMSAGAQAGYGATGYGASSYGGYGQSAYGQSSYGSPYSRYGQQSAYGGGYGSSYGSSYGGGYNSPYSRYGGGGMVGGGYNRFGGGGMGMGMGPNGEMPLSAQMEQSTQATFGTLDAIVQAFAGFSQMLESTFMATHSSFQAMVGVAEQFGNLRQYFGQIFSLVSLYGAARRLACRIAGRPVPVDTGSLTADEFQAFEGKKKQSKKPLWVFLFFTVGIPWLISKLYQRLQKQRIAAAQAAAVAGGANPNMMMTGPDGTPLQPSQIQNLEFCRALHDFKGESPLELMFNKGDVVAILSKIDPTTGNVGVWWRGRLQDGRVGAFPANYVEIIRKKGVDGVSPAPPPLPSTVPVMAGMGPATVVPMMGMDGPTDFGGGFGQGPQQMTMMDPVGPDFGNDFGPGLY